MLPMPKAAPDSRIIPPDADNKTWMAVDLYGLPSHHNSEEDAVRATWDAYKEHRRLRYLQQPTGEIPAYMNLVRETDNRYSGARETQRMRSLLRLGSEYGELLEIPARDLSAGRDPSALDYLDEVGDCLFNLARLLDAFDLNLEDAIVASTVKLQRRNLHGKDKAAERADLEKAFPQLSKVTP